MRTRLALLAAALAGFGGSLASGFHFDDFGIFSSFGSQSALQSFLWCLRQTRPLTYLTFWLNYRIGGSNPLGYHSVNLAFHLAAVWLLYEILRQWLEPNTALLAAAVFAVHPMQAEAVDYIWARSILIATVFCLLSLREWSRGRMWVAAGWFALGLLAKEECAAFPLALLALPIQPGGRAWRRDWKPYLAMFGMSLLAGLRVIYATAVTPGAPAGAQAGISPWHYFLAQGPVIWRYLRLLVIPVGFTVDPAVSVPPIWLGLAAWAAIAAISWRWRWMLVGFVLLLPSSSIFPAQDLAADRRMYFPLAAFAVAAALCIPQRIAIPVVISLAVLSMGRTYVWMSDERLWRQAVAEAPDKIRPRIQLSRRVAPGEALSLLRRARELAPGDPAVATETGKVLLAQGNAAAAVGEFGRALALAPNDASDYNNRGAALEALGLNEAARQDYLRALAIDPALTAARRNLERMGR